MSSNASRPKQSSRWGSLLSGAVAGIESRLDTILAEDNEASAKSRAADKAALEARTATLAPLAGSTDVSRSSSRSRVNDRLQERLAKAVHDKRAGSQAPSEVPTRTASPLAVAESPRSSLDTRPSTDSTKRSTEKEREKEEQLPSDKAERTDLQEKDSVLQPDLETPSTLLSSGLPINPARMSTDSEARLSIDSADLPAIAIDLSNAATDHPAGKTSGELEVEMAQMRADYIEAENQRQEEMHANLERIDALQAKLQYLAKESVAAAKQANTEAPKGSLEQRVAERDEKIALLMEEGEKLSKTEMRHLATIRKMRTKTSEDEKTIAEIKQRVARFEQTDNELKLKVKRLEQSEQQNRERLKRLPQVEIELRAVKSELESSRTEVKTLQKQLSEAEKKFVDAEREVQRSTQEADRKKMSDLQEELSDAKLERKLAEERSSAEVKRLKEAGDNQRKQSQALELELRNEISNLETRMETLRYRAEEASSDTGGDSQAKLLRQIETLQTQYSLAAENWRSIEGSLNTRVTAAEKERDEATKRETDVRKRARDMTNKSRRFEDELESASEQSRKLNDSLEAQRAEAKALQSRLAVSEKTLQEAKADLDRQRRIWEAETAQRLEEERSRQARPGLGISGQTPNLKQTQAQSPTSHNRKSSALDSLVSPGPRRGINRVFSNDSNNLVIDRAVSRRSSVLPTPGLPSGPFGSASRTSGTPDHGDSPTVSRQVSTISLSHFNGIAADIPPTPSINTADVDGDYFDRDSSPHQNMANEVMSATTVHTGPSVQLVERMSSSIRRLESEKAAHKEELARLLAQRDEARNEVVALMREMDGSRGASEKVAKLEDFIALFPDIWHTE